MKPTLVSYVLAGAVGGLLATACGGAPPKYHDGYTDGDAEPWKKATPIKLNDAWQGAAEATISFPERKRAKWYVLDVPVDGSLTATLAIDGQTAGADVGFEILDSGFNARAQNTEDDEGQAKKTRQVNDNRAGKSYLHIWALKRTDVADIALKVAYTPAPNAPTRIDPTGSFPYTVKNPPELAMVGADDSPKKGGRPVRTAPVATPDPVVINKAPPPEPIDPSSVRGSVVEFGDTGSGVRIIINKGNNNGVEEGWEGYVLSTTTKRAMPNGSFKIRKVKNDESEAVVKLSLDDIQANRSVVLKKPK